MNMQGTQQISLLFYEVLHTFECTEFDEERV